MTDIPLLCPVEPHEMSKPMRAGFNEIVRRVTVSAAAHGWGNDLLLRIYTAGIYHGVELQKRTASVGRNPKGEDREDGLRADHEHAVGAAETPTRSRQSNKPGREM